MLHLSFLVSGSARSCRRLLLIVWVAESAPLCYRDLLVARGEVMVLNDSFCIRITEVFSQGATGQEAAP